MYLLSYFKGREKMKTCVCAWACLSGREKNIWRSKQSSSKHKAFKEVAFQEHIILFNENNNNNKKNMLSDTGNDKLPIGMKVTSSDCQNVK